jgi:hypothetical protein
MNSAIVSKNSTIGGNDINGQANKSMVGFGGGLTEDSKSEIDDHSNNSSSVIGGGSVIGQPTV